MPSATIVLGKRKRKPADKVDDDADAAALKEAQAIFRKHFEAQFAPLEGSDAGASRPKGKSRKARTEIGIEDDDEGGVEDLRSEASDSDEGDEWGGLSGDDVDSKAGDDDSGSRDLETEEPETETNAVEVVDHSKSSSTLTAQTLTMTKREMRAYLSSLPPDPLLSNTVGMDKTKQGGVKDDDPQNEDSKSLLANDLALQRLIAESHILSASNPFNSISGSGSSSTAKTFAQGRTRALTTDLRLQKLGSKGSVFAQKSMPMHIRQGINSARSTREEKRRREAKENGIILEKEDKSLTKRKARKKRELAVDLPGMGKMKGAELHLSKREVREVEMEGKRMDSGGKRRRRRR